MWRVDCPDLDTGHCTFHASFIRGGGGEGGGFIFFSANRKGQGALLLFFFKLMGAGTEDFFFSFPCFLMCSHGVPSKFLMGS